MTATTKCPGCGASASGRFCNQCGTPLGGAAATCAACRQPLQPGARFCRHCGAPAGAAAPAAAAGVATRTPWLVAGAAALAVLGVLIAYLVKTEQRPAEAQTAAAAAPGGGGAGAMPSAAELAAMGPKERFDRLYNRVMRAAESGDEATVQQFSPMAKMAYAQLDSVDADSRYHMALLMLHTGEVPGAKAMADTLLMKDPGHLFGYMINGTIARFTKDQKALGEAYGEFKKNYDAELKKNRVEYTEHERSVTDFKAAVDRGA